MKRLSLLLSTKIISVLVISFFLSSCYYDNLEELHPNITTTVCDTTGTISYSNDIVPIMNNNCGTGNSCHNSSSTSGITLDNYADVRGNANSIVKAILHDPVYTAAQWMPSGGATLNSCSIMKIQAWVNRGRLNN